MRIVSGQVRLAATDVSNHLACHHLTQLELSAARGQRERPQWEAPDLAVIRELGLRHEARYFAFLEKNGLELLNLAGMDEARIVEETRRAMAAGVELIAQGALRCGRWFGRPDLLRRVARPSWLGRRRLPQSCSWRFIRSCWERCRVGRRGRCRNLCGWCLRRRLSTRSV